jgi:hypothetical protein
LAFAFQLWKKHGKTSATVAARITQADTLQYKNNEQYNTKQNGWNPFIWREIFKSSILALCPLRSSLMEYADNTSTKSKRGMALLAPLHFSL